MNRYVIDVNGWSFVKGNQRYYDKAARVIRKMCLGCARGRKAVAWPDPLPAPMPLAKYVSLRLHHPHYNPSSFFPHICHCWSNRGVLVDGDNNDICRGLVAIFRHADRTPKQKVKLKTKEWEFLSLFKKHDKEVKVKNKQELAGYFISFLVTLISS
jgi:inositol hexakisphosphate/diphosphoinositol-pentakisphosphate kinase